MRTLRRSVVIALMAVGAMAPLARPAAAGVLDGKVAIVTGAARGLGRH